MCGPNGTQQRLQHRVGVGAGFTKAREPRSDPGCRRDRTSRLLRPGRPRRPLGLRRRRRRGDAGDVRQALLVHWSSLWALHREHRMYGATGKLGAAVQEEQLQNHLDRLDAGSGALNQLARRLSGAAGGQDVIHDQGPLATYERVGVNLDDGASILQLVLSTVRLAGQLACFADGYEPDSELVGNSRAQDEAARLDTDDDVHVAGVPTRDFLHDSAQGRAIAEQRGEVLERQPRAGKVRDVAKAAGNDLADRSSQRRRVRCQGVRCHGVRHRFDFGGRLGWLRGPVCTYGWMGRAVAEAPPPLDTRATSRSAEPSTPPSSPPEESALSRRALAPW